jgi:hypothetical protein
VAKAPCQKIIIENLIFTPAICMGSCIKVVKHIFVREHGVHAGPKDYFVVVVVVVIRGSI